MERIRKTMERIVKNLLNLSFPYLPIIKRYIFSLMELLLPALYIFNKTVFILLPHISEIN